MNQFMIGLVLVIIIIILIVLLGALNKMYPEGFFGTCKGQNCTALGNTCNNNCDKKCVDWKTNIDSYGNVIGQTCNKYEYINCFIEGCKNDEKCKCE